MASTIALAALATTIAGIPIALCRRRLLLNPAFFVFLIVLWSVLLKALYLAIYHSEPIETGHDRVFVAASSADFFVAGASMVLVGVIGYVGGFLIVGERSALRRLMPDAERLRLPDNADRILLMLVALSALSFGAYLLTSATNPLEGPFSAKRFLPRDIGVASRFLYPPYYFFKLALLSGSITFVATLLLCVAKNPKEERSRKLAFATVYLFALLLGHFASLRLFILLVLVQTLLLVHYFGWRRRVAFMGFLTAVTVASFALITYMHRAPLTPEQQFARGEQALAQAAREAERARLEQPGASEGAPEEGPASADRSTAAADAPPGENASAETLPGDNTSAETRPAENTTGETPPTERALADTSAPETTPAGTAVEDTRPVDVDAAEDRAAAASAPPRSIPVTSRLGRAASSSFEGRYFMDVTKLAHYAHHFPSQQAHLNGAALISVAVLPIDGTSGEVGYGMGNLARYLAINVFDEPRNSIAPGYAGELYINFGWLGVFGGFVVLGVFHRVLFNNLNDPQVPALVAACLVALIPSTTLVLLNSTVLAAAARSVLDIGALAAVWVLAGLWSSRRRGIP